MSVQVKIENLPFWVSEVDLKREFVSCWPILESKLAIDERTSRSLGFGYLTFSSAQDAKKALAFDGKKIDGQAIKVSLLNLQKSSNDMPVAMS